MIGRLRAESTERNTRGNTMNKIVILLVLSGLLGFVLSASGQGDLAAFSTGTTKMVYRIVSGEMQVPQSLEVTVVSHGEGQYTLSMFVEASGSKSQLSSFGFLFGGASLLYGSEGNVSYSSLQAVMGQRSRLEEGQEYLLPDGGTFGDIVSVEIAGVRCLEGSFIDPAQEDTRIRVAFELSHPVYMFPRTIIEKKHDEEWVEVLKMELSEYTFTALED